MPYDFFTDGAEMVCIVVEGVATWAIQPIIVLGAEHDEANRFTLADAVALLLQVGLAGLLTVGNPNSTQIGTMDFDRVVKLNVLVFIVLSLLITAVWWYAVRKLSVRDIVSFVRRFVALTIVFPFWLGGTICGVSTFVLLFCCQFSLSGIFVTAAMVQLFLARCTANWIAAAEIELKPLKELPPES